MNKWLLDKADMNCPKLFEREVTSNKTVTIVADENTFFGASAVPEGVIPQVLRTGDRFTLDFGEGGQKIFAAIAAGLCIGTAVALALKAGGSTGGADILAVLIQKKFAAGSIAWMLFAINSVVIASSLFVFKNTESLAMRLLPIMMSVFEAYIESKTNESVTNGFQSAREFRIITDKPDEISQALMFELSRGVTALPATGMYTKEPRTMLLCVVNRRQVATLRKITKAIDPDSFVVMTNVSQVLGLGFYTNDI
jgi:uncharacterized membrane-anchored protein YitT (DUF2179 family)